MLAVRQPCRSFYNQSRIGVETTPGFGCCGVHLPYTLYLLALCQAYMFICTSMLITISALIGLELADNKALATLPLALQFVAVMATTIPASLIMGRWGRKAGFIIAALIGITGAALSLIALKTNSFGIFCLGTICFGSFNAFGNYYRFTAPEVVDSERKNVAISWVMAGGVLAAFLGPNLANWSQHFVASSKYAGAFLVAIFVYLLTLLTVSCMTLPPPQQNTDSTRHGRPLRAIMLQPVFLIAVTCAMLGYGIMNLVMTATPLAMHTRAMELSDTAFVIQWHVVAMFAPSFFTGRLIDRFGITNILLIGALLNAICVVVNLLGDSVWHFWAALVLLGVGWNFLFVGGTTLLTECYSPEEKSKTQAANDFIVFTTVSITALSSGTLHHLYGFSAINLAVIPLIAIVTAAVFWLKFNHTAQTLRTQ